MAHQESFFKKNWLQIFSVAIMAAIVIGMGYLLSTPDQTKREILLEQSIATIMAVGASFLITKIYAEKSSTQNLRDNGVQIASGIMVLRRHIEGLSEWVSAKRTSKDCAGAAPVLEHVEQTLLGFLDMTNVALNGIGGVIGDALAQYESVMDSIGKIRTKEQAETFELAERMEQAVSSAEAAKIQLQMQEIAEKADQKISELAHQAGLLIPPEIPQKRYFTGSCPYCGEENQFGMMDMPGQTVPVTCRVCSERFNAHVAAGHRAFTRPIPPELRRPNLLKDRKPVSAELNFSEKCRVVLDRQQAWVGSQRLRDLVNMVLSEDRKLRKTLTLSRSPAQIQKQLLEQGDSMADQVGRKYVRIFMKLLMNGRAFQFSSRPTFYSTFSNELTEETLLKAYVSASIYRIGSGVEISDGAVPELTRLLLGDAVREGESLVHNAVGKYLASVKQTFATAAVAAPATQSKA